MFFQQQITDLILVHHERHIDISLERKYRKGVYGYILKFFENLRHFSFTETPTLLSLRDLPLTTCSSSILYKLCLRVARFEDCLALLDGRLKCLTTFIVSVAYENYNPSIVYRMVS